MSLKKFYRGFCEPSMVIVEEQDDEGNVCRVEELFHVRRHSPTGFSWGYLGSGPADLALAILTEFTGNQKSVENLYQGFKIDVIANLDTNKNFTLYDIDIKEWLERNGYYGEEKIK